MNPHITASRTPGPRIETSVVVFGIAIAAFLLYLLTFQISLHHINDFYSEAWPAYHTLSEGHVVGFLQQAPAYVGSLILRAPFALLANAFGASQRVMYYLTALPCVAAPALLAGWLAAERRSAEGGRRGVRPLDLCALTPPFIIMMLGGHPEDALGAVLCIVAVLLAVRGSGSAAGFAIGVALINKSWALVAVPLVLALMPADRRPRSLLTLAVTVGIVMIPVVAIRANAPGGAAASVGTQIGTIFLVPQLLWWFGKHSWVAREAHVLLVGACWVCTGIWWWAQKRYSQPVSARQALLALALVLFLRAALDPWDNLYYQVPFMLAIMTYEDRGFPRLTWLFTILLPFVATQNGAFHGLGGNAQAAIYAAFAVPTIAWLAWRSVSPRATPAAEVAGVLGQPQAAGSSA